jgi:hypothetical protein
LFERETRPLPGTPLGPGEAAGRAEIVIMIAKKAAFATVAAEEGSPPGVSVVARGPAAVLAAAFSARAMLRR